MRWMWCRTPLDRTRWWWRAEARLPNSGRIVYTDRSMHVNLYATFRLIAGQRSLEINLAPGTTARQAVAAVLQAVPDLGPHWVNNMGELHTHVHGFINGQEIPTLEGGWETLLQPEDVLDFLPPVAGG